MKDNQRKAMFANMNNPKGLSAKELGLEQSKKFGISTKGTIGLTKSRPKEVRELEQTTNELDKLNILFKQAVEAGSHEKLEDAYDHAMLGGAGGREEDVDEDEGEDSNVGILAREISTQRINDVTGDEEDYYKVDRIGTRLQEIGAEMGNFWWDNQSDTKEQIKNLKEVTKEIDGLIPKLREITKGF